MADLPGDAGVGHIYTEDPAMTAWSQHFFTFNEPVTYLNDTGSAGQPEYPAGHTLNAIVLLQLPHTAPDGKLTTLHLRLGLPEGVPVPRRGLAAVQGHKQPTKWSWYFGAIPTPQWAPGPNQG